MLTQWNSSILPTFRWISITVMTIRSVRWTEPSYGAGLSSWKELRGTTSNFSLQHPKIRWKKDKPTWMKPQQMAAITECKRNMKRMVFFPKIHDTFLCYFFFQSLWLGILCIMQSAILLVPFLRNHSHSFVPTFALWWRLVNIFRKGGYRHYFLAPFQGKLPDM